MVGGEKSQGSLRRTSGDERLAWVGDVGFVRAGKPRTKSAGCATHTGVTAEVTTRAGGENYGT